MTKKDFFDVFIKCFGIIIAINAVFNLVPNFSFSEGNFEVILLLNGAIVFFMLLLSWILIYKTRWLIKLFRLSKGFDSEEIVLGNLTGHSLLKNGIILSGLFLIVDNLPNFLNSCFLWFKKQVSAQDFDVEIGLYLDNNWWMISGISIFIGIIMVSNSKGITAWFIAETPDD